MQGCRRESVETRPSPYIVRSRGSPGLQKSLLIQSHDLHCKSPRLRTVLAQFHHLEDRLISVSPKNRWTCHNVITVTGSLVSGVAASKRRAIVARLNLSASALVNHSFVHRIREHYPTPPLQHRRLSPIGKTAVSDGLASSLARKPVYSASATLLVYIIIVSSKIARPTLPLFILLHCTCGICRLPYHISPDSYSSPPRMAQIENKVHTSRAAFEESPPDRFESV
jgi:hypothetical protein